VKMNFSFLCYAYDCDDDAGGVDTKTELKRMSVGDDAK
jgi:hypothetical protein